MKHQEKKYLVKYLNIIERTLVDKSAKRIPKKTTMHNYAELSGNDVVKLVVKKDRNEIHILEESGGKFTMTENILVEDVDAGLKWLKEKGYKRVGKVKIVNTNYEYKTGVVGLYIIDDWLHSVILDFPPNHHKEVEKEFGLQEAEVIKLPYNKYLEKKDKLQKMEIF